MSDDFVHLHVHSEYSLLDGLGRVSKLTKRTAELGQPALAITDHGTMHGAIEFVRAAHKAGIKPILGVEAYLTHHGRPMEGTDSEKDRYRHHLLLLAENMTGYRNLLQICSDAQLKGYYYKPRIDADYLAAHKEGLICTTGCFAGEVPNLLKTGQDELALERLQWYAETFGPDRFYVEFQEHDIPELTKVNKRLFEWANQYDIPMIATNDVHYVNEADAGPHDTLLCVQTSSLVTDPNRMRYGGNSYFLKSLAQMQATFQPLADLPSSAFSNTVKIAEMCAVDPEDKNYHLPDIDIPEGFTYQSYLRHLTEEGIRQCYKDRADDPAVQARMEHELKIIHEMGFDVYFLIVWDLCMYAKSRDIWWNVRGSGAGSIVAYAIGLTYLDPLKNKLIFERFLNPGRVSMPDFDLDFPDDQREELIRYTVDKYGHDQVAQIVTFGRMKARAAVRDIGRAMAVPLENVDRIAKMIPAIPGKPVTISDVLTEGSEAYSREMAELYAKEEYVRTLLDTASHLEGVARHSSIHAAAVIVADRDLTHYTPLMRAPKSAVTDRVTQYEFPILESIGLLKVDFLGLATLTLMREATQLIKTRHGIRYTLENIPLDDPKTYDLLSSGDVMGVFQVEGQGMRRMLMELRPSEFDHIVAAISLYRPGPMDFIPDFIAVLHGEQEAHYVHPTLEPILAETMGVCVYQEQVIQILTDIAGYSAGEADIVRRGISKKKKDVLDEHREIFAKGSKEISGLSRKEADEVWDALMGFARYGFNRAHAADYAVIVAQTGYLKAYYPTEYMAALLTIERHNTEKVGILIAECRRMGIEVLPPNINVSVNTFTIEALPAGREPARQVTSFRFPIPERAAIRMGLDAIKNVGEGPVETIIQGRGDKPFASLADFANRVDLRQVNRRGLEFLIKAGAMENFGGRGQLLAGIDRILGASTTAHTDREVGQMNLFGEMADCVVDDDLLGDLPAGEQVSPKQALEWEKELVGVFVSSHPLQQMTVDLGDVISHGTVDITEELNKMPVLLGGMIADVRQITTRKGDPMAFVRLEDLLGSVDITVFPKLYEETRELWVTDKIVIIHGKVDVRNGRVNVLADSVQDYVVGKTIIEDTSSVGYRHRNGNGAPAGPAPRPPAGGQKSSSPSSAPPAAGWDEEDTGYLDSGYLDSRYPDYDNPFAGEAPAWMEEEEAEYMAITRSSATVEASAPTSAPDQVTRRPNGDTPNPAPAPADAGATRSAAATAPMAEDQAAAHSAKSQTSALPPTPSAVAERPAAKVALPTQPAHIGSRTLHITFRRSQSLDADRRRLADLVALLSSHKGEDRFRIVLVANGAARYELDFPNNYTQVCRALQTELTQRLGADGWSVEG